MIQLVKYVDLNNIHVQYTCTHTCPDFRLAANVLQIHFRLNEVDPHEENLAFCGITYT